MTWRNGACATAMHKSIYKVFFLALYLYLSLSLSEQSGGNIPGHHIPRPQRFFWSRPPDCGVNTQQAYTRVVGGDVFP